MPKDQLAGLGQIRSFWESQTRGGGAGQFGVHSDANITDLENWYVINYALKPYKPTNLLDVGCGKGDRTRILSRYVKGLTVGIDYSEGMIDMARKLESSRLRFHVADILREPDVHVEPDMIVSCRCLINLGTQQNVLKALHFFHRILPSNGKLVLCECSKQGHKNLNDLRRSVGLKPIKIAWHNINLDEELLVRKMRRMFRFSNLSRLGVYYLLTRVLHPKLALPAEPNPGSKLNLESALIQQRIGIGVAEEYGRQYCTVATKIG